MIPVLRIMTTSECNNNCDYCFVKTAPNYKAMGGNFEKIHESMQKVDYTRLEIIGGEPFHDVEILKKIFEVNDKPVTFFTSGTYNTQAVFDLCADYIDKFNISFYFSYDGKYSKRNGGDYENVKGAITLFKTLFRVAVRWSINIEDIPHLVDHFKEINELTGETMFFPMKYKDYTDNDISLFGDRFQELLNYCRENKINFNGLLSPGTQASLNKIDFECPRELTILPNGKFTSCYVAYSSFGFPEKLVSETTDVKTCTIEGDDRCEDCLNVFNSCNKCVGNLREYQIKTDNTFHHSYCDLMNELGKIFINDKIKHDHMARFAFYTGDKLTSYVEKANGYTGIYKLEGFL